MFEIHYHLLFGVDDGPKTIEGSIALAEASIAEGVTHLVSTPHANSTHEFQPEVNRERLAQLQSRLGDRITLGLGCDFHLSYENINSLHQDPFRYTINGKQYLLIEFPDFGIFHNMSDTLFDMTSRGLVPIITHPERNPTLAQKPGMMADWLRLGCLIQITAASLTGRFGKQAQAVSFDLLKRDWVHILASDAHSVERRGPCLSKAHEVVQARFGQETADRLCIHNPRAVFFGEPMPQQPEPKGVFEEYEPPKRGLLARLFGK